jgi:hypothetical protein
MSVCVLNETTISSDFGIRKIQKFDRNQHRSWDHIIYGTDHKPALFENSLSNKGQLSAWKLAEVADLLSIVENQTRRKDGSTYRSQENWQPYLNIYLMRYATTRKM